MAWQDKVVEVRPHTGKVRIELVIECGEHTCASEPGKFCKFVGATNWGTVPVCMLFVGDDGHGITSHTVLKERDGWLQRCDACKEHGRGSMWIGKEVRDLCATTSM